MKTIEFFYENASPWSYLAEKLVPRVFEGLTVVRRPTYLRAFAAIARGLFGVPSFVVGDEVFWGHDRMEYARRAARAG